MVEIDGNVALNGSGKVLFDHIYQNVILGPDVGDLLTVGTSQTIAPTTGSRGWIGVGMVLGSGIDVNVGLRDLLILKGNIQNDGRIHLNDALSGAGNSAVLQVDGDVALVGGGQLRFDSVWQNIVTAAAPGSSLTIGPEQSAIVS